MTRSVTGWLLGALVSVALLAFPVTAQQPQSPRSPDQFASHTSPTPSAKETARKNYFSLRLVAFLQRQLTANPNQLPLEVLIAGVKTEARKLVKTFEDEKIDPDIREMAADLVDFTERYEKFLTDSKLINANYTKKLAEDEPGLLWQILVGGAGQTVAEGIKQYGGESGDIRVAIVAEVAGFGLERLLNYLRDLYSTDQINKERYDELSAASDKLTTTITTNQQRHLRLVKGLREQYGWDKGEVGFDATEEETAPFRKPLTEGENVEARIRSLKTWKDRRNHDPFGALEHAQLAGKQLMAVLPKEQADLEKNAKELIALARSCRAAADDVPEGAPFDGYRLALLREGGHLANNGAARFNIAATGARYGRACKDASVAVDCWEQCLKVADDDDGFLRMRLAFAIGLQGDLKEAQQRAAKVAELRKFVKCGLFANNFAAVNSRLGKTGAAMDWLEIGASKCGMSVRDLEKDPDFANVCRDFPERMKQLGQSKK